MDKKTPFVESAKLYSPEIKPTSVIRRLLNSSAWPIFGGIGCLAFYHMSSQLSKRKAILAGLEKELAAQEQANPHKKRTASNQPLTLPKNAENESIVLLKNFKQELKSGSYKIARKSFTNDENEATISLNYPSKWMETKALNSDIILKIANPELSEFIMIRVLNLNREQRADAMEWSKQLKNMNLPI